MYACIQAVLPRRFPSPSKNHKPPSILYTIHPSFTPFKSQTKSNQHTSITNSILFCSSRKMATTNEPQFEDFLPIMADKLGGDGLIGELCNGFRLLMDADKGVITFDSLKKNSRLLGLGDLSDDDVVSMLREGDFDGDGGLNQMEFCVLMFRLSPNLMAQSEYLLEEALEQEFGGL